MEYGTGQVARLMGVHPNTVRLYEKAGLIAPARAACSTGASIPTTWCAHATICAPRSSRRNAMRKTLVLIDKAHAISVGKCVRKPSINTPGFPKRV